MADLTIAAADVAALEIIEKFTAPAAEAIDAGEMAVCDETSAKLALSDASSQALLGFGPGIALRSAALADEPVTILKKGIVGLGAALAGLAYDAAVYSSDTAGKLADAAGTVTLIVGYVVPVWDGTTPGKALRIDL